MAVIEDLLEAVAGSGAAGIGAGVVAVVVAPRCARPVGRGVRWLVKNAIKGSLFVVGRARSAVAGAEGQWIELYKEARAQAGVDRPGGKGRRTTRGAGPRMSARLRRHRREETPAQESAHSDGGARHPARGDEEPPREARGAIHDCSNRGSSRKSCGVPRAKLSLAGRSRRGGSDGRDARPRRVE